MAFGFFSKDKNKGPREVTCPLCQHSQQESPLAVSSYCKGCKAYLSFDGGEVTARSASGTPDPFAHRPAQPKVEIDYSAREEPAPLTPAAKKAAQAIAPKAATEPSPKPQPAPQAQVKPQAQAPSQVSPPAQAPQPEEQPKVISQPQAPASPAPPPEPKKEEVKEVLTQEVLPEIKPLLGTPEAEDSESDESDHDESSPRYHRQNTEEEALSGRSKKKKEANERHVACFECGDSHIANSRANSTQCRKCGRLISLKDQHIKENWSSPIQTRGNVYIHKKGIVSDASIRCHDLVVEGDFTGSAECSGDLTLRRHGKVVGNVICNRLLVQKRAQVEFLNLVEMNECKIDGVVTGNISCRGLLALEKKATLIGDIKVGSLTVADGAKHSGQIQMGAF